MSEFIFVAQTRTDLGKGASRRLRRTGFFPAVIYGAESASVSLTVNHNEALKQFRSDAVYSNIVTVQIDGKNESAILRDIQRHPYKPLITHIDFLRVSAKELIVMSVPLHFINDEACKGVKQEGGQITHLMSTLEVSCLPQDLPEFIEVDLIALGLGETIHVSNLALPKGVTSTNLTHGSDEPVVSVIRSRGEAAEATPAV
jgi:large subunit ribosomal protein L25